MAQIDCNTTRLGDTLIGDQFGNTFGCEISGADISGMAGTATYVTFIWGTTAFVAWTVASFLCHQSAKVFLKTGTKYTTTDVGIVWAAIITLAQMTLCYLITDIHSSVTSRGICIMKVSCHILATMATNYSMTLIHASSTFAIKLLEPVTSAIVQYLTLGTSISITAFLSLPIVIGGALVFCGSSVNTSMSIMGLIMAAFSNIILAVRNVAIKMEQGEGSRKTMQLRHRQKIFIIGVILAVLVVLVEYFASQELLAASVVSMFLTATCSSVFHVIYSHISTNIVLMYMSVISHSVANISKRVLVVLLLSAMGQRGVTLTNLTGLAVCTVGLLIYVSTHQRLKVSCSGNSADLKLHFPLKKIRCFGLLLICCCGLTFIHWYANKTCEPIQSNCSKFDAIGDIYSRHVSKQTDTFKPKNLKQLPMNSEFMSFLHRSLIHSPTETNVLSPVLTSAFDVTNEAQRIHINIFSDMFAKYKYAMLFDVATFENKGDPAITVGEVHLLRRLGIELVYYCNFYACTDRNLDYAKNLSSYYSVNNLIVLLQGGGTVVGYEFNDHLRGKIFKMFTTFEIVLFPQSIYLTNDTNHLRYCQNLYQNKKKFTMILRDKLSLQYAQKYFNGKGKIMMAPDMAFHIGPVQRFISPSFDILWLKRSDGESLRYELPKFPPGVSIHNADWWSWKTPEGETSMETAFMMANNGLIFVQRGRVVITDRLHGHILSTLCDIPHVLIDNNNRKLSSYHNTWTRGLANTVLANNASHALQLAMGLLKRYGKVLPQIKPFMNIREKPEMKSTVS